MKIVKPSVATIKEPNPFKKIEIVGRTCYKSTSEMTLETAKKFYKGLVSRQHFAMVEHATFVFQVFSEDLYHRIKGYCTTDDASDGQTYLHFTSDNYRYLISGNLRAINDERCLNLLAALYQVDPDLVYAPGTRESIEVIAKTSHFPKIKVVDLANLPNLTRHEFMIHFYMTFHFICDRGVSHESVRHRPASFAQESTRYCNYSKGKFGGISCIEPANFYDEDFVKSMPSNSEAARNEMIKAFEEAEDHYMRLLSLGCTPQQARAVLPTDLKTELIMTANAEEWEHFFNLRSKGTTGAPHPDIKRIADEALSIYEFNKGLYLNK